MEFCSCFQRLISGEEFGTCPQPFDPPGHRYLFWKRWGPKPLLAVVMLNPRGSTQKSSKTRERVMSFARQMNLGGIVTANAFALCAGKPRCLHGIDHAYAVGPKNDAHLRMLRSISPEVISPKLVVAWGGAMSNSNLHWRVDDLYDILGDDVSCWQGIDHNGEVKDTTDGQPWHPAPPSRGRIPDKPTLRPYTWPTVHQ
jgi:hypothetical protein